jgi:hypothetical protein
VSLILSGLVSGNCALHLPRPGPRPPVLTACVMRIVRLLIPLLVALAPQLVCAQSSMEAAAQQDKESSPRAPESHSPLVLSMVGDGIATTTLTLEKFAPPTIDASAYYMTVGPLGAEVPDTRLNPHFSLGPWYRRLRVTLGGCEMSRWLVIDEILTGRADTHTVKVEYRFNPMITVPELWEATQHIPRVTGTAPSDPPIRWLNPTAFTWVMSADTLVVEQKVDSIFQITIRPRMR